MIEVKFTFATIADAQQFLSCNMVAAPITGAVAQPGSALEAAASNPEVTGSNPVSTPPTTDTSTRVKPRGRPRKEQTAAGTPCESPQVAPAATSSGIAPKEPSIAPQEAKAQSATQSAAAVPAPTDTDVRQALQRLCEKHGDKGLQEVSKFIGTFKQPDGKPIQRVSELRPEQYADVIAKVAEAVK